MFPLGCRAFFRQRCVSARLSRFLQAAVCFRSVVLQMDHGHDDHDSDEDDRDDDDNDDEAMFHWA